MLFERHDVSFFAISVLLKESVLTRIAPWLIAGLALASRLAQTPMILFNAALAGAFGERLLVLRLEQPQVAGREPPSEQRSEGQPG